MSPLRASSSFTMRAPQLPRSRTGPRPLGRRAPYAPVRSTPRGRLSRSGRFPQLSQITGIFALRAPATMRLIGAMPALANAHDHARAVKPVALGALELPLELWLAAIVGAPRVDPYLIGAVAFGRSALGGAGSVMCHYVRPQGGMSLVDEAREIARAARDVGVRIAFALSMRDRNAIAYGEDERTLALVEEKDRAAVRSRLSPKT